MSTGFIYHQDCLNHITGPGHPERPDRLQAIIERMDSTGLRSELDERQPEEAEDAPLLAVHSEDHVQHVIRVCNSAPALLDGGDTPVSAGSLRAARLAAGGVIQAAERVSNGEWNNAFVACRPPGHHAERAVPMGFCMFNNIAIAAEFLKRRKGIDRVAIVDWDVHHGNGTQHTFDQDPDVFFASLHQWPHYPGTGSSSERGIGAGDGTTLNCPMDSGTADAQWLQALETQVIPQIEQFRPDFLLISAGFDAHELDPLSGTRLTAEGYRMMTRRLKELASKHCQGRLVSVLEGGYSLEGLSLSVNAHLEELRA